MSQNVLISAFNRGMISKLALARTDLKRTDLSSEIQTNWMPRMLGSMMLRPGLEYIDPTRGNLKSFHIPFVFSSNDTAIIELTNTIMRVRVDEVIISRISVSTAITNGGFSTDLSGWTDADEASDASSDWVTGSYMGLTGSGIHVALRKQHVTVSSDDQNKEHALRIVISRGPVSIRVGSSDGTDDYITEVSLRTGVYSLAFTPSGDFYIWLFTNSKAQKLVKSINIETSGEMQVTAPWIEADLQNIRYDTSGDVIFVACNGYQQRRIERHNTRSWGIALYEPDNGPFRNINSTSVTMTPSALSGNVTLTTSFDRFKTTHVGALFRITSIGQNVSISATGNDQWSDPIQISGVGSASRGFTVDISGTWTGTVVLERSIGDDTSWQDIGVHYTGNTSVTYADGLDNQIIYYRIGFLAGYGSGTAVLALSYANGGLTGIARVTSYVSKTVVNAEVLKDFGSTTASVLWSEGEWSDYRGFPSAVVFTEGRLFWAGKDKILGSVTDGFEDFDDETVGDSAPISRSLGSGPVDTINWLLPLQRLIIGTDLSEVSARSSSLDDPLTPTNFTLKSPSTRGSSAIAALKVDGAGLFVRNNRLFELSYQGAYAAVDYSSADLTNIVPEVGGTGFTKIAVQRYPDTRIHCLRSDGLAAVLVYDPIEEVKCWILVETDGEIEDVFVLPGGDGSVEDKVYYVVKRTVNGNIVRYLEKWALEGECIGGYINKLGDSFTLRDDWTYPGYTLTPSGISGSITLTTSGAFWTSGYIGKVVRINGGRATITAYSSTTVVTATTIHALDSADVAAIGDWSFDSPTTNITGLSHLEGEGVVVWADGIDIGTKTVSAGAITLTTAASDVMVGLPYTAQYKSTKLAYAAEIGTALTQKKRVNDLGLILANTHALGLRYGRDTDNLDDLPLIDRGAVVGVDYIWDSYDSDSVTFNGAYDSDSRIYLESAAPRPCTVLALVLSEKTNDRV